MPNKKSKSRKGPQKGRGSNATNRKRKTRILKREVSGRGGSITKPPADLIYRSNILAQPLQSLNYFKISTRHLQDHGTLPSMLTHLYKCLFKAPEFVDDKEWETYPEISELAEYLFGKVKTIIPKGFDWVMLEECHGAEFCIKYFKPRQDLYRVSMIMPLEWTEDIKTHRFYETILFVVYQVQKEFNLDFIIHGYNESFLYEPEADFIGEDENDDCIKLDIKKYEKNGEASLFIDLCKKLDRKMDRQNELERLQRFQPTTPLDKKLKAWLLQGFKILETPFSIFDFCFPYDDPDMDNSEPLMINGMTGFEWSFHDTCYLHAENWRESISNEIGMVEPVEVGYFTPTRHKQPTADGPLLELYKFCTLGQTLYNKHFDKKLKSYYDKRANNLPICPRASGGRI